jgi:hypothetical protein
MFAYRPFGASLKAENPMGELNNEGKQNPGLTDEEKKRERERAGQNPV